MSSAGYHGPLYQHQPVNMGDADVGPLHVANEAASVRWALYVDCAGQARACILKASSLGGGGANSDRLKEVKVDRSTAVDRRRKTQEPTEKEVNLRCSFSGNLSQPY